jgi:hypothetical protein
MHEFQMRDQIILGLVEERPRLSTFTPGQSVQIHRVHFHFVLLFVLFTFDLQLEKFPLLVLRAEGSV